MFPILILYHRTYAYSGSFNKFVSQSLFFELEAQPVFSSVRPFPFRSSLIRRTTLPAIHCHNGMASKQRRKLAQLDRCHLHAALVRADALLFEHRRPTAELLWQEDDRRKLPARADRLAAFRQVRLVHYRAIRGVRVFVFAA